MVTAGMIEAGIQAVRLLEYEFWEGRTLDELEGLVTSVYQSMSEYGRVKRP